MKEYTSDNPVFSAIIKIIEETDPGHADNINAAITQLLQNTLSNREFLEDKSEKNHSHEYLPLAGGSMGLDAMVKLIGSTGIGTGIQLSGEGYETAIYPGEIRTPKVYEDGKLLSETYATKEQVVNSGSSDFTNTPDGLGIVNQKLYNVNSMDENDDGYREGYVMCGNIFSISNDWLDEEAMNNLSWVNVTTSGFAIPNAPGMYMGSHGIDSGFAEFIAMGSSYGFEFREGNVGDGYNVFYSKKVQFTNGIISANSYETHGADYAEYFEWEDSNPDDEERVGHFVTIKGSKIIYSSLGDNLRKVGVVSAAPAVVGDSDKNSWRGYYQTDIYGRIIWGIVHHEDEYTETADGTRVWKYHEGDYYEPLINPNYDPSKEYIPRKDRPEWDYIGTHGKLVVIDDGTCEPDGFCVPADGGIATAAEDGFYVMERLDENHIRIYMK